MNYFESKFTPIVYKALQSQIKAFIADMKENGIEAAKANLDRIIINEEVYKAVQRIYKTVGIYFANETYGNILKQVPQKGFGFNAQWIQEILNYFQLHLLNKAVLPISATTRQQILNILEQGEREGWGVDKMAYEMRNSEITLQRARLITRTESAKAAFAGREKGKENSPYALTTQWISAKDHRTRHSHLDMNGKTIDEGQQFLVPIFKTIGGSKKPRRKGVEVQIGTELMIGPGDPKASKGNIINCRCTTAERVKFDENDNPIMKRQYAA